MGLPAINASDDSQDFIMFDEEERKELAALVAKVLSAWRLTGRDKALVLGFSPDCRSTVNRYEHGHPVAQSRDLIWRIGHLLAIYEILHASDLDVPERADAWPTKPNVKLGGRRPVDIMQEPDGLAAIRSWLEVSSAW